MGPLKNNFKAHPVGLIDLDHTKAEISKDDSKRFTLSTDSTNTDKNKVKYGVLLTLTS